MVPLTISKRLYAKPSKPLLLLLYGSAQGFCFHSWLQRPMLARFMWFRSHFLSLVAMPPKHTPLAYAKCPQAVHWVAYLKSLAEHGQTYKLAKNLYSGTWAKPCFCMLLVVCGVLLWSLFVVGVNGRCLWSEAKLCKWF